MKKILIIAVIDIVLIIISAVLMLIYNNTQSLGLSALEDAGKFAMYLCALIIEVIVLIALLIIFIIKKIKN